MTTSPGALAWNIAIYIILIGITGMIYIIACRGFRNRNFYSGFSTLACAILFTFFFAYDLIFQIFPWPYGAYFVITTIIIAGVQIGFWLTKRKKWNLIQENLSSQQPSNHGQLSIKQEYLRKSFHLAGILVPIGYYWVFPWINNLILKIINQPNGLILYELLWGDITDYPFVINDPNAPGELLLFVLWCCLIFMVFFDFIRIFTRSEFTLFHRLLRSVLREKEYISIGPQVLLVLGAVVCFFLSKIGWFSYEIAVSSTFTACIADGLVAVLGRRFGKHKVRIFKRAEKSLEGFLVGFFGTYLCSMIILGPIYAIVAAVIFLLLDVFTIPIADNLLNPIALALGVWGAQLLFQIPIGWGF